MSISWWSMTALLAYSLAATAASWWLAERLWRRCRGSRVEVHGARTVPAHLLWAVLVFASGVIAVRYVERSASAAAGYTVFVITTSVLSLCRAWLYINSRNESQPGQPMEPGGMLRWGLHQATYLLLATVLFLLLSLALGRPVDPVLLIPLAFGALLPDLDSQDSVVGRLLPVVSRRVQARLGHRQEWHTIAAAALIGLITAPFIPVVGLESWYLVLLGFGAHLALDLLEPEGLMLLWPLRRSRFAILAGKVAPSSVPAGPRLALALAVLSVLLAAAFPAHRPAPPAAPSYEQVVQGYHALQGRNLVFADVDGAWQATNRRVAGRFEVVGMSGPSFILLDRYSGAVFLAGRQATDHMYLNLISLVAGSAVRIKPVEVQLHGQRLMEALPVVYQMQAEAGLQHIFVSGEVTLAANGDGHDAAMPEDSATTRLRRIRSEGAGRFSLYYLSGTDLIGLANLWVQSGQLVIVATYAEPPSGPTATPLPSPPPTPQVTDQEN